MRIADICTHKAVHVGPAVSVSEAAAVMRKEHVGCVVVTTQPNGELVPVGILTDRDIVVEVVAAGADPTSLVVADIMTRDIATCGEDEDILDAIETMRTRGVRRLPVLNAGGGLAGIVALDDIYGALGAHLRELGHALTREQVREMEARG